MWEEDRHKERRPEIVDKDRGQAWGQGFEGRKRGLEIEYRGQN